LGKVFFSLLERLDAEARDVAFFLFERKPHLAAFWEWVWVWRRAWDAEAGGAIADVVAGDRCRLTWRQEARSHDAEAGGSACAERRSPIAFLPTCEVTRRLDGDGQLAFVTGPVVRDVALRMVDGRRGSLWTLRCLFPFGSVFCLGCLVLVYREQTGEERKAISTSLAAYHEGVISARLVV
jgi:hypothetical protein